MENMMKDNKVQVLGLQMYQNVHRKQECIMLSFQRSETICEFSESQIF